MLLAEYFQPDTGKQYGVGFIKKFNLVLKMMLNNFRVTSASNFLEHLIMAACILKIPSDVNGCVVKCGSYKGGSTTNISLVCDLCGRSFEIFDSFAGLPDPKEEDKVHVLVNTQELHTYEEGSWTGTLEEEKMYQNSEKLINVIFM